MFASRNAQLQEVSAAAITTRTAALPADAIPATGVPHAQPELLLQGAQATHENLIIQERIFHYSIEYGKFLLILSHQKYIFI
jgi:hypothetical protein